MEGFQYVELSKYRKGIQNLWLVPNDLVSFLIKILGIGYPHINSIGVSIGEGFLKSKDNFKCTSTMISSFISRKLLCKANYICIKNMYKDACLRIVCNINNSQPYLKAYCMPGTALRDL